MALNECGLSHAAIADQDEFEFGHVLCRLCVGNAGKGERSVSRAFALNSLAEGEIDLQENNSGLKRLNALCRSVV